jgi:hypothetical protein
MSVAGLCATRVTRRLRAVNENQPLPAVAASLECDFFFNGSDCSKEFRAMAKTQRKLKKANHGRRPASSKARRLKRGRVKV